MTNHFLSMLKIRGFSFFPLLPLSMRNRVCWNSCLTLFIWFFVPLLNQKTVWNAFVLQTSVWSELFLSDQTPLFEPPLLFRKRNNTFSGRFVAMCTLPDLKSISLLFAFLIRQPNKKKQRWVQTIKEGGLLSKEKSDNLFVFLINFVSFIQTSSFFCLCSLAFDGYY